MSDAADFLKELATQNVIVWADSGKLRYKAPKERMTPTLVARLREEKPAILSFIQEHGYFAPLSHGQQALWFVHQGNLQSAAYNIPVPLRLLLNHAAEPLDTARLRRGVQALVDRHAVLRTIFTAHAGVPLQNILPHQSLAWEEIDVSGWPWDRVMAEVHLRNQRSFNLETGPLLRVSLFNRADGSPERPPLLFLGAHHIVCDDWSTQVLADELTALYLEQNPMRLPPLERQYTDYIHWQSELLAKEGQKLKSYWQQQLAGELPALNLPTDRPRPPVLSMRGKSHSFALDPALSHRLRELARAEGVTLYMLLFSAFQLLLHRYTGQDDILTGSPTSAGRQHREFAGTVGYFVNPIVLRSTLSPESSQGPSFREFLAQVRQTILQGLAHQEYPFPLLVRQLAPARDASRSPIFQSFFVFQNLRHAQGDADDHPALHLEGVEMRQMEGQFDLILAMEDGSAKAASLIGTFKYHSDLFEQATIARMSDHWRTLLTGIVDSPADPINLLPLLSRGERHQIMTTWNDSARAYPEDRCFHQLFEAQVERAPDATALVFVSESGPGAMVDAPPAALTYRELNQRANQVARYLRRQGVGPEVVVGLYADRSLEMIVALLGIFKAGGAYLPLDPAYPPERLAFMMQDAQVSFVLTQTRFLTHLSAVAARASAVALDQDWSIIAMNSDQNPPPQATPDQLAYLIYTSGSTGQPKGTLVEHGGLTNLVCAQIRAFDVQPESRVLQVASFNFDASISEIAMALGAGAALYLAPAESLMPGLALTQLLQTQAITHVTLTPSALAVMSPQALPQLHTLIVAGEACSAELVKQWAVGRRFFNAYGPTENSVCATIMEVTDSIYADGHRPPPIGRPMDNVQVYILDRYRQPAPIGVPGELYIGGAGVARGYLNQPALTTERFIPIDEFGFAVNQLPPDTVRRSGIAGQRLYRTGDLARYLPDGMIEFLGRMDQQVKVRGYRIELEEIEAQLKAHPGVQDAVALAQGDRESRRLVAYWTPTRQPQTSSVELRRHLSHRLPDYMIPALLLPLDAMPLSPNGKVDRHALPDPEPLADRREAFVPPGNELESQLATIWGAVLGVTPVGAQDDFFELGGHSLLAIQLLSQIEEQCGQRLPLTAFLQGATVTHLAQLLAQKERPTTASPLVAIQPTGNQKAFFVVHPVGGNVLCYRDLAQALGVNQPIYGLQSPALTTVPSRGNPSHPAGQGTEQPIRDENGMVIALDRIEEMATYYIDAIETVQPQGPYYLGGWSMGGVIAYEMAQQWLKRGESVAALALIESYLHTQERRQNGNDRQHDETRMQSYFIRDLAGIQGQDSAPWEEILRNSKGQSFNEQMKRIPFLRDLVSTTGEEQITQIWDVFRKNYRALLQYQPKSYPGQLILLRAKAYQTDSPPDWAGVATGGVITHWLPGDHYSIIRKPYVQALAEQLQPYLPYQ